MKSLSLSAVATLACLPAFAQGAVILYDDFDGYPTGELNGQTGQETAYANSATWDANSSGTASATVSSTSLAYMGPYGYTPAGGKAVTPSSGFNGLGINMDVATNGDFGTMANGTHVGGGTVSGTLYFSFFARNAANDVPNGTDDFAAFQLLRGTNPDSPAVLGIGNHWSAWAYSMFGAAGDRDLTTSGGSGTDYLSMDNAVHLFVAKITYNANAADDLVVWMDPTTPGSGLEPASSGLQSYRYYAGTGVGDLSFDRVSFRSGSNDNNNSWEFDEVRMGTTWSDVVPEPSALLLGLAGFSAALRRRR